MTSKSFYPELVENFSIKEVGFKLSPDDKLKLRSRLNCLEQKAPAISTISLNFCRNISEQKRINAELIIHGGEHEFRSKANGSDPVKMYLEMEKEVEEQLSCWKKNRLLYDFVKDPVEKYYSHITGGLVS